MAILHDQIALGDRMQRKHVIIGVVHNIGPAVYRDSVHTVYWLGCE